MVPLEWKNDKGRSVLIRSPRLIVCELGQAGNCESSDDGESHTFRLVREYQDISGRSFAGQSYDYRSSLVLEPHTVSTNVLAFRLTQSSKEEEFQFKSNTEYRVEIDYLQDTASTRIEEPLYLGNFCLKNKDADMVHSGRAKWNWWPVDEYDESCQGSEA